MDELVKGQRIKIRFGGECQIIERLGKGGQGTVYSVEYNGNQMALKWYSEHYVRSKNFRFDEFYKNICDNIDAGSPTHAFLWPQEITEEQHNSFGYLMELRPPEYEDFSQYLLAKVKFHSVSAMINSGLNIVNGFRVLHQKGYGYQDLNDGNFFINPKTGDVLICDNDNVAPYGENLGIAGKCRYMAPEIVLKKKNPDQNTDKFSLAVVLYLLLFMNHPLEGKMVMRPCITEELERKFYGSNPVFMYDPTDDQNRPVVGIHTNAIRSWPIYTPYVRETFVAAFTKSSMACTSPRVIEKKWQEVFTHLRDDLVICGHCGKETFISADRPKSKCINCQKLISTPLIFESKGYKVPLMKQKMIYQCHTDLDNDNYSNVSAEVKTTKGDPSIVGIKNLTDINWIVTKPNGELAALYSDETIEVEKGMIFSIGGNIARIE